MRTPTCLHNYTAFLVFSVFQTWRQYKLVINLSIVNFLKQNISSGFLTAIKLKGVDQIAYKNDNKSN